MFQLYLFIGEKLASYGTQSSFDHLSGLKLADSGHEGQIDILVGSDWYWELVTSKVKVGNSGEPVGVKTKLG